MGYIHCCGGLRKCKTYAISPEDGFMLAQVDYLAECPVCGHTIALITRIDIKNNVSFVRKINDKARKLFDKIKASILFERKDEERAVGTAHSRFYLCYNEYGKKKKCYSNLSTLKMGLFENRDFATNRF